MSGTQRRMARDFKTNSPGVKREVPVTCRDCRGTDMRDGVIPIGCWTGRAGTRLCKEFRPRLGVKIVKEKKQ